jgi:predicted transposase YbfD/YdcC
MADFNENRIFLSGAEAEWFIENSLHPNRDVLRRRDANFERIDSLGIVEENGAYSVEIPDFIIDSISVEVKYYIDAEKESWFNRSHYPINKSLHLEHLSSADTERIELTYNNNELESMTTYKTMLKSA